MCPWVGPHAPSFRRQLWGLPSRVEYLSPQGVLLPLVYGTTASPLWFEVRGHSARQATPSWTVYRLACQRLLPWLQVTFAMVPDAAWPGSEQWPWSTAPAPGPVGRLGRPGVSNPWGVDSFLSLVRPMCARCPGPLGSCSLVRSRGLLCRVCGVLGHLAPVHRCARSVWLKGAQAMSILSYGTKADALRKIIERNLHEFGWLEGCRSSEWCSAPFTVPKPPPADQSSIDAWHLVVNYRSLNAATVSDAHPLPYIEEEMPKRAKGKLFTVLDLRHGFHPMPLRKEDRHLTAMCAPCGTVQWTVMPMGLKNARSMFQKMMETVLFQKHKALGLQEFCSIYIDDLLIATPLGKNFDECLKLR